MAQRSRLCQMIGLAMKAGRLVSGDFAVEKLVRSGKALLGLIDETASGNTRDKYAHLCSSANVTMICAPELGASIGKPARMLAAVTDENFANLILSAADGGAEDHTNDRG